MIRFIVERHECDFNVAIERKDYRTLDVDLPELEALLTRGGRGECGFELWRLLGAEVLEASDERCELCDNTGDIHRADGEWLGECPNCDIPEAK